MEDNFKVEKIVQKKERKSCPFMGGIVKPLFFGLVGSVIGVYAIFNYGSKVDFLKKAFNLGVNTNKQELVLNGKQVDLEEFNKTSTGACMKALPSIVNIQVEFDVQSQIFGEKGKAKGSGSGIIISEDGYILTNNHVITPEKANSYYTVSEAKNITVTLSNNKQVNAKVIGTDAVTDLAVIKIEEKGLTPATLGDSSKVQIGEFVLAIGSPLGLKTSVTSGIVSAVNRSVKSKGSTFNTIQTNASINEGNSGGALVNSKGEVIGVNTLKLAGSGIEGIGFAIPINETKIITEQLIKNKKVDRPTLGFSGVEISETVAKQFKTKPGILVKEIIKNSTAEKAGLKEKDILLKFNGKDITSFSELERLKVNLKIGEEATFVVLRDNKELTLKAKIVKAPEENKNEKQENTENSENNINKTPQEKLFERFFGE